MKAKGFLHVIAVHSEHSYVQHPFFTIEDEDYKIYNRISKFLDEKEIEIYKNHITFECVDYNGNPIYLGYNDGRLSFGHTIGSMMDSKTTMIAHDALLFIGI